jgi:hypothetical protein
MPLAIGAWPNAAPVAGPLKGADAVTLDAIDQSKVEGEGRSPRSKGLDRTGSLASINREVCAALPAPDGARW